MGVIDKIPSREPAKDEEGNYIFSSKPGAPGERGGELLVRFQAVSRTQQCMAYQYITVNSRTRLSVIRRHITKYFKNLYERGFIFLSKTKEILKSNEKNMTVFDILPKVPQIQSKSMPNENFLFQDVQYKRVYHNYDGKRYVVMCACVVYLFERSKVSHWPARELRIELQADTLDGFAFIPTDILSWSQQMIESRATNVHIASAKRPPNVKMKISQQEKCRQEQKHDLQQAILQIPPRTTIHDLCDQRLATPLHYAAASGNLPLCEVIIAGMGKDQIYAVDVCGKTPLHCAFSRCGPKLDTIVYLLQLSSGLYQTDVHGNSPIGMLTEMKDQSLKYIAEKLEFDCVHSDLLFFFLYYALSKKKAKLALKISAHATGGPSNSHYGENFLHLSAPMKETIIVDNILKRCKFDKMEKDITGRLPFHVACKYGHVEHMRLLYDEKLEDDDVRRGMKVAINNKQYHICRHICSLRPNLPLDEELVCSMRHVLNSKLDKCRSVKNTSQALLEWESLALCLFPVLKTIEDAIAVYVFDCARWGLVSALRYLISVHISVNISDQFGRTPLHEASQGNKVKCLEVLLYQNVFIDARDQRGSTALHYACESGHLAAVRCLKDAGADGTLQDICGRTPLMVSIYRNKHDVATYLINRHPKEINLTTVDNEGCSILHYSPFLPEESLDILLEELKCQIVDKDVSVSNQQKKIEARILPAASWMWNLTETSYKASFPEYMYEEQGKEWSPSRDHNDAFSGLTKCTLWVDLVSMNQEQKKDRRPMLKTIQVCSACNRFRRSFRRSIGHVCKSGEIMTDIAWEEKTLKPFDFHAQKEQPFLTPVHIAVRARRFISLKKMLKFDATYASSKDNLGRTLVSFAIEQGSSKLLRHITDLGLNIDNANCVHDFLIMHAVSPVSRDVSMLSHLLTFDVNVDEPAPPENVHHHRCLYHKVGESLYHKVNFTCNMKCHWRSDTPLEVAILIGNLDIYKLILQKCKSTNLQLGLHFVSYFGNSTLIDLFHKKRQKVLQGEPNDESLQTMHRLDSLYAITLACCSPNCDVEAMTTLLKYHPEALKANNCVSAGDLTEIRKYIEQDIDTSRIEEVTPLAKLMSPSHPAMKTKRKQHLDNIGCLLVDSGLNLGSYRHDDGTTKRKIHGACEALYAALLSKHHKCALSILKNAGFVIWHCALTNKKCDVQNSFCKDINNRERKKAFEANETFRLSFIKYMMYLSSSVDAPEKVLKAFISSGEAFVHENAPFEYTVGVEEVRPNKQEDVSKLVDPIAKILVCVHEVIQFERINTRDVLRILKYAPAIYPFMAGLNPRFLDKSTLAYPERMYFRTLARFMMESELPDHPKPPDKPSLLHVACSTDKVEFIRLILNAPIKPKLKDKTTNDLRAIDIAASQGHLGVVKLLLEKEAAFTSTTLLACCVKDSFRGVSKWAKHIQYLTGTETATEKARVRIFKELCKMKELDLSIKDSEYGSILFNAVKNRLSDIIDFIVEKNPQLIITSLNEEPEIAEHIPFCQQKTVHALVSVIERNVAKLRIESIGKVILCFAQRSAGHVLNTISAAVERSLSIDAWNTILRESDKHGKTPMHFVAINRHRQTCKIFLRCCQERSIVDFYDLSKNSPLWYALTHGHLDIATDLLLWGASPKTPRAVPDLRVRRYIGQFQRSRSGRSSDINSRHMYFDKAGKWFSHTEKRTFSHKTNTSFGVAQCINPGVKIFEAREDSEPGRPRATLTSPEERSRFLRNAVSRDKRKLMYIYDLAVIASNCGSSLVHIACSTGDESLLQRIIDVRGKLDSNCDGLGLTPLTHSMLSGDYMENILSDQKEHFDMETAVKALVWKGINCCTSQKLLENVLLQFVDVKLARNKYETMKGVTSYPRQRMNRFHCIMQEKEFEHFLKEAARKTDNAKEDSFTEDDTETAQSSTDVIFTEDEIKMLSDIHRYLRSVTHYERQTSTACSKMNGIVLSDDNLQQMLFSAMKNAPSDIKRELVFLLLLTGQGWSTEALLDVADCNKNVHNMLGSNIFGDFNALDCLMIAARTKASRGIPMQSSIQPHLIERLIQSHELKLNEDVILQAADKNLWSLLQPIAISTLTSNDAWTSSWQRAIALAAARGELDFIKAVCDRISISKLPVGGKQHFAAYLCLAALFGKTSVTKYFLRSGAPVVMDNESSVSKRILGEHFRDSWNVLHFAIKGNSADTVETVIKFCKFEKEFMQGVNYDSLYRLAAHLGSTSTAAILLRSFRGKYLTPSKADWEAYLLKAAQRGQEEFCIKVVSDHDIDFMVVDERNRNLSHYCAIYDMDRLMLLVQQKAPTAASVRDLDGYFPYEYAILLGNHRSAQYITKTTESQQMSRLSESPFAFGWLRYILETRVQNPSESVEALIKEQMACFPKENMKINWGIDKYERWSILCIGYRWSHRSRYDRTLSLENIMKNNDDHLAQAVIDISSTLLRKAMTARPNENAYLLHHAAKYGCVKSLSALCDLVKNDVAVQRLMRKEIDGLTPLACSIQHGQFACTKILIQIDDGTGWKSTRTGETILHIAAKSGHNEIVQYVTQNTKEKGQLDSNQCTPLLSAIGLGEHNVATFFKEDVGINFHCSHDETEFNCVACLLDLAIGWSKLFLFQLPNSPTESLRVLDPTTLVDLKLKPCLKLENAAHFKFDNQRNSIVASIMIAMGYEPTEKNILIRRIMQPSSKRKDELLSNNQFVHVVDDLPDGMFDPLDVLLWSISQDNKNVFEKYASRIFDFSNRIQKRCGVSCYELVIGRASYKCLEVLQKYLDVEKEGFETFTDIKDKLPVTQRWLSRIETPGDSDWFQRFKSFDSSNTSERLSSADIWLVSSIPKKMRIQLENAFSGRNWIPSEIKEKKYAPDIESFKKSKHLAGKTEQWIQCFIGSGAVAGHMHSIAEMSDAKVNAAQGFKISCLQKGSGDHSKTYIEGSGNICATVELFEENNSLYVIFEDSLRQREIENTLRESIIQSVLPRVKEFVKNNLDMDLNVRIDWNSIEIRKRNWNVETVLKALNGDIFSNALGGLEDVLQECHEMRCDIADMFNTDTLKIALLPVADLKEITVAFDDKKPVLNEQTRQKSHLFKERCTWLFTLENSRLLYNRETFPLWQYLNFYRGACASVCSSLHSLSIISPERMFLNPRIERNTDLTVEIDWKSFGVKEMSSVRSLITQPISRELIGIAYDCLGMMWLHQKSNRILIKNTPSQQHSGISFQGQTAMITIHPSTNANKQWIVERTNVDRLNDSEDRQLLMEWDSQYLEESQAGIKEAEDQIESSIGLSIKCQMDEKRVLLNCFPKFRREITHPNKLILRGIGIECYDIPGIYERAVFSILDATATLAPRPQGIPDTEIGTWTRGTSTKLPHYQFAKLYQHKIYTDVSPTGTAQISRCWEITNETHEISFVKEPQISSNEEKYLAPQYITGPWTFHPLSEGKKKMSFVSFKNDMYQVDNRPALLAGFDKLSAKFSIGQEVADMMDKDQYLILERKIIPIQWQKGVRIDQRIVDAKVCATKQLSAILPIEEIALDHKSFTGESGDPTKLLRCTDCLVETIEHMRSKDIFCYTTSQRNTALFDILHKCRLLHLIMDKTKTSNGCDRRIECSKSSTLSCILLSRSTIHIIFSEEPSTSPFVDDFQNALTQFAELQMSEYLPIKPRPNRRGSVSSIPSDKQENDVISVRRPPFVDVLDVYPKICKILRETCDAVPSVKTISMTKIGNICFSKSTGKKIRMILKCDTLVVYIPGQCPSTEDFAVQLLSCIGVSDNLKEVTVPVFNVVSSDIYFPESNRGRIVLGFYNLIHGKNTRMLMEQSDYAECFDVQVTARRKEQITLDTTVEHVEQTTEQHFVLTWSMKDDTKLDETAEIKVFYKGKEIECASVPMLPQNVYILKNVSLGSANGSLSVMKNGSFYILLLHSPDGVTKGNRKEPQARCSVERFRHTIHHVQFTVDAKRKVLPGTVRNNPIVITYCGSRSKAEPIMAYKIKVLDSIRDVSIAASCTRCGQSLALATPLCLISPGDMLRLNISEDV